MERANGLLQQKLGKWREDTGRHDWSVGIRLVILSMNHSYCRSHKKTSYELVYGDKPHGGCTLVEELFSKGIYDEENIPETIKIGDFEYLDEDLDNDIINEQDKQGINIVFNYFLCIIVIFCNLFLAYIINSLFYILWHHKISLFNIIFILKFSF